MTDAILRIEPTLKTAIWSHLLPRQERSESVEQAAFAYATTLAEGEVMIFNVIEWLPMANTAFTHQSSYHIELADEMRPLLIKRAHDLQASLIEFHSHPFSARAQFSPSDLVGLNEFVPHVWWRLKGRPYLAIVVTPSRFDALAWIASPTLPIPLREIRVGNKVLRPSGTTLRRQRLNYGERKI